MGLRCFVMGHETDELASYYGHYECLWCDCEDAYLPIAHGSWRFDGVIPLIRCAIAPIKSWILGIWRQTAVCEYCGNRNGWGHTPECLDRLPF